MSSSTYLLAGQASELERLQLQSRVWEPSGRRLLAEIGGGRGGRAVDIGCGVIGWLGLLSEWVGQDGEVVGTDIDDAMLCAAEQFVADEGLGNVLLEKRRSLRHQAGARILRPGAREVRAHPAGSWPRPDGRLRPTRQSPWPTWRASGLRHGVPSAVSARRYSSVGISAATLRRCGGSDTGVTDRSRTRTARRRGPRSARWFPTAGVRDRRASW